MNDTEERKEKIVRAKWSFDGAETVDEMAEALESKAEYLRELRDDGWELDREVQDDYAFLVRSKEDK